MPRARVSSEDASRFGAIIRRLRLARGWTLADFAKASGMNATYLGVLERGGNMPSLTTILQLADLFGIDAADIVREVEQARRASRALQ
jgi:transcriptional regulator with XRE-family HTH domain